MEDRRWRRASNFTLLSDSEHALQGKITIINSTQITTPANHASPILERTEEERRGEMGKERGEVALVLLHGAEAEPRKLDAHLNHASIPSLELLP